MYIGKRIKELRESRGIKLRELAQKSGVQIASLSRMEHLRMVGSLESHMAIADALGVDITQLYTNILKKEDIVIQKPHKTTTDIFVGSDKSSYEILTAKVFTKKMMPILLKIEPGGKTNKELNRSGTEKFVYVLEGKVEVTIKNETYPLAKNNTLYFDASEEHWLANAGDTMAKLIVVTTPLVL